MCFYGGIDGLIFLGALRDLAVSRRIHTVYLIGIPLLLARADGGRARLCASISLLDKRRPPVARLIRTAGYWQTSTCDYCWFARHPLLTRGQQPELALFNKQTVISQFRCVREAAIP